MTPVNVLESQHLLYYLFSAHVLNIIVIKPTYQGMSGGGGGWWQDGWVTDGGPSPQYCVLHRPFIALCSGIRILDSGANKLRSLKASC